MKKIFALLALAFVACSCLFKEYPVDEDGLIITDRAECAVLNFDLLDPKNVSALEISPADIDTVAQTVHAVVKYRAEQDMLWPVFTLSPDCKLEPKIRGRMDFTEPREFTVISGNRKVRKTYVITVTKTPNP